MPKVALAVDEDQARLAGFDHTSIAQQLNSTLDGAVGGSVLEATEELPVRVRAPAGVRGRLERVASLDLVPSGASPAVSADYQGMPMSVVGETNLVPEIATVPRFNGRRMNEVQAFITAGVLPAEVLARFEQRLAESALEFPPARPRAPH